ncbi:hypothetical protein [Clostridium tunisiense]|uniref:hypothetical protein n=1 Tax=Clostridium tunisiense TaxID=219748 RepID=UPI0002D5707C|nr:hypothetical protein [Clostridium tunisiense]
MSIVSGQACVVCGKKANEVNSKVLCPKYEKLVCMKHCFDGCKYLEDSTSRICCTYRFKRNEEKKNMKKHITVRSNVKVMCLTTQGLSVCLYTYFNIKVALRQ